MIAFEVTINDNPPRICGFEDWGLIHASILARRPFEGETSDDFEFRVSGVAEESNLNEVEHVNFGRIKLQVGDHVSIQIVNSDEVEKPIKRYRSDALVQEDPFTEEEIHQMNLEEYERLKVLFASDI